MKNLFFVGFGNIINPVLSLADRNVYNIPMLLMIGWRGEPGRHDEPQHLVQGKIMSSLLDDLNIPFEVCNNFGFVRKLSELELKLSEPADECACCPVKTLKINQSSSIFSCPDSGDFSRKYSRLLYVLCC